MGYRLPFGEFIKNLLWWRHYHLVKDILKAIRKYFEGFYDDFHAWRWRPPEEPESYRE